MSLGLYGDPLPDINDHTTRAILTELREELAHSVNLSRVLHGLTDGERTFLRRILCRARDLRARPDFDETALSFGRRGRL